MCDVSDVEEKGISYLYDKLQHLKVGTNTQFHLTEAEFVQLFMSSFRVDELLDDITFIREMKHMTNGSWHQFDILFDSQIYGWEFMVKWAEYMGSVDLENISEVTIGELIGIRDITKQYHENGHKFAGLEAAAEERGMLSIAGLSKTLRAPVKIMWFNQTRVIRFFTLEDDETLMKKYAETVARWSFETENAMKLGKPILS